MNRTAKTVRLLQAVAAIAGLAVLLWSLGLPSFNFVEAANLTDVSNTLTDSDPSTVSDHTIEFVIPTGSNGIDAATEVISVTFPTGFTGTSSIALTDVDLEVNGTDQTLVASGTEAANQWGFEFIGNDLILVSGGGTAVAGANATVTIEVGNNAVFGGAGADNQIVNPAATGTYEFVIDVAAGQDTGKTNVVIIDNVDVTASVDTLFTFAIRAVAAGQPVNGDTTTGPSTATTIPFGTLTAGNASTTAQQLEVTTNAEQGYVVTVTADGQLDSSTGADIDGFIEGAFTTDPTAWQSPVPVVGSENTYGHWGITSDDTNTFARGAEEFASGEYVSPSTTPIVVMGNDGPSDGTGTGVGTTTVGYKVEISSLQEAADDYNAVLTYVATPTF